MNCIWLSFFKQGFQSYNKFLCTFLCYQVQTTQYGGKDAQWAKRVAASWEEEDMIEYRENQDEEFQVGIFYVITFV